MNEIDHKRLIKFINYAIQNFKSWMIDQKYESMIRVYYNYDAISDVLFQIPMVLSKIIIEYTNYEFTMYCEVYYWRDTFRREKENGINISFHNKSFGRKDLHRILIQQLSKMKNKLNVNTILYRNTNTMKIRKKLNQIYHKYNLCQAQNACCVHDLEKIIYKHRVSTPQTDIFYLTTFLYNTVVEIIQSS